MGVGTLGLLMMAHAAAADTAPTVASVVQAVEAKYDDVSTMQADFVQTTHSQVFGADAQSGELVIKRPSMMRWAFADDKQFVTDGDTMWVYSKADNQVIRYDDIAAQRSALDSLLSSLHQLDELFEVKLLEGEGTTLELKPRDQAQVKAVKLELTQDLLVKSITITDPYDSVTELQFSNVRLDVEVPDSAFVFQVPKGVQLIEAGSF